MKSEFDATNATTVEQLAWIRLCEHLEREGFVTDDDLASPVTERDTPGQETLHLIREWGEKRVTLEREEP